MSRSGKISVSLPASDISQVRRIVEGGEYGSAAAVMREALRAWLHRRALHAGAHGAVRLARTLEARREILPADIHERVELLFDAGDAKA